MLMSRSLWNKDSRGIVSNFSKVYKTIVNPRRAMTSLLNNGSECENVISRLVIWAKTGLSFSSEMATLQIIRESLMQSHGIKFGECMSHHDSPVIVRIRTIP
jgi:hypothetical protein